MGYFQCFLNPGRLSARNYSRLLIKNSLTLTEGQGDTMAKRAYLSFLYLLLAALLPGAAQAKDEIYTSLFSNKELGGKVGYC